MTDVCLIAGTHVIRLGLLKVRSHSHLAQGSSPEGNHLPPGATPRQTVLEGAELLILSCFFVSYPHLGNHRRKQTHLAGGGVCPGERTANQALEMRGGADLRPDSPLTTARAVSRTPGWQVFPRGRHTGSPGWAGLCLRRRLSVVALLCLCSSSDAKG